MKQEPSDKFICLQRHGLFTVIVCIIPPEERDIAVPDGEDSVIAESDPVGISAEVLKDPRGTIKGWFAIDDPLLLVELSYKGIEVVWFLEATDTTRENNITSFEATFEVVKKLTAEQRRHDPYWKEKPFTA